MNRKIVTIVLAVALIAGFFLPLNQVSSASAFDVVKAPSYGMTDIQFLLAKYLWILIPLSGVILLIGALNNGNYFLGRGIWTLLPLLAILYIILKPIIDGYKIGDMIKGFGVGMIVMTVFSLILAVFHPKK